MGDFYIPQLELNSYAFPTECSKEGLVAWGGDMSVGRLFEAYKNGVFPWFNTDEPILWWSPNPRCVLFLEDLKVSKSLKKSLKKYHVTYDKNFLHVIKMCQEIRIKKGEQTWIDERIINSYKAFHDNGYAHCVEVWYEDEIVGGLYGVCIGKIFCGESMFSNKSDASKVALVHLVEKLKKYDFKLIDCQISNPHLLSLGATNISKKEFLNHLKIATNEHSGFDKFSNL